MFVFPLILHNYIFSRKIHVKFFSLKFLAWKIREKARKTSFTWPSKVLPIYICFQNGCLCLSPFSLLYLLWFISFKPLGSVWSLPYCALPPRIQIFNSDLICCWMRTVATSDSFSSWHMKDRKLLYNGCF